MSDGSFLLSIHGQIEWIDLVAAVGTSWHCKYELIVGPDWNVLDGIEAGVSQTANVVYNGSKIILNLPIEATYKSSSPFRWPQLILSVYSGKQLMGYGRTHIPITPGMHCKEVPLSKPEPSTLLGFLCSLLGFQPELLQPHNLATGTGNSLIRMISNGAVRISLNVITQGFRKLGYDCS